jgi:hypothetical protein
VELQVSKVWIDCDEDTILVEATCLGDGVVCHTGTRTCFRELPIDAAAAPPPASPATSPTTSPATSAEPGQGRS